MKAGEVITNVLKTQGEAKNASDDEFDPKELKMGIEVELEHAKSRKVAKEIAKDHLKENPKYYTQLEKSGIDRH